MTVVAQTVVAQSVVQLTVVVQTVVVQSAVGLTVDALTVVVQIVVGHTVVAQTVEPLTVVAQAAETVQVVCVPSAESVVEVKVKESIAVNEISVCPWSLPGYQWLQWVADDSAVADGSAVADDSAAADGSAVADPDGCKSGFDVGLVVRAASTESATFAASGQDVLSRSSRWWRCLATEPDDGS